MSRFTKEFRQEIVREFAIRHNGQYDASLFLQEVRDTGSSHPAYEWFTWDDAEAANQYRIEQARGFARDLTIVFKVEEVTGPHQVRIRESPMPAVISPMATRNRGGGYVLTDPDDPEHIAEHCRQAAAALAQWKKRYVAALAHVGLKVVRIDEIVAKLECARPIRKAG